MEDEQFPVMVPKAAVTEWTPMTCPVCGSKANAPVAVIFPVHGLAMVEGIDGWEVRPAVVPRCPAEPHRHSPDDDYVCTCAMIQVRWECGGIGHIASRHGGTVPANQHVWTQVYDFDPSTSDRLDSLAYRSGLVIEGTLHPTDSPQFHPWETSEGEPVEGLEE